MIHFFIVDVIVVGIIAMFIYSCRYNFYNLSVHFSITNLVKAMSAIIE